MTCHAGWALDDIFLLQIVHQPIVKGMRGFGCAREFGNLVTGQSTPALVIERVWRGTIYILYVMDRTSSQSNEERTFRDAVGVDVGETYHGLIEERLQLPMLHMAIDPIYAVLCRVIISHLVGWFETERLGSGGSGHALFLDDRLILSPTQKPVIDNGLSTNPSHVRLGMIRIDKIPTFYRQLRQH